MNEIDLDYGAITIDNSTLKGRGYNFHEGLLAQLNQFKKSPVQVIQTDIVHNEAVKHISQEISKARTSVDQALRSASKHLKIRNQAIDAAMKMLSIDGEDKEVAEARLAEFYGRIGAQKINSADHVDLSTLMDMYFHTVAPFETGKDKKNEFPDAIALLSIEGWADKNDLNIIAVSEDKGWIAFAEHSERITLVSSLSEALEKFQPHNKVSDIIYHIREASLLDESNSILEKIQSAIIEQLDGADIDVEADSAMFFEWEDIFASYISHDFDLDSDGLVKVSVIRIEDKSIVLRLGALVEVEVEASFDFSVRDSIDKDYVGMGGNICRTNETYHTDILLTLSGDFSHDVNDIEVTEVEILENISVAHFGEVEPDWYGQADERSLW